MVTIKNNELLAPYTYMKVGGSADQLAIANSVDDLVELITYAIKSKLRYFVLGGGSNTIFSDNGFRGLVIVNRATKIEIDTPNNLVKTESGAITNSLVNMSTTAGLAGLETFLGVPGTIGGAIYNNSHYLNQLIGDYVSKVELLHVDTLIREVVSKEKMEFAYDYSILHKTHDCVLSVEFKLSPGDPAQLKQNAISALTRRKNSQPLNMPSSGCMFQNFKDKAHAYPQIPPGITSAGALIDAAGLKGMIVGGAQVSTVHANFIVNTGNASTRDIIDLSNQIIDQIHEKYGFTLEREVFFIDEFGERIHT